MPLPRWENRMNHREKRASDEAGTIVLHPRRAVARDVYLCRRIATDRARGIAGLHALIDYLTDNAGLAGYGFAEDFLRECERMLVALEALDPAAPPPVETIRALARRMDRLGASFCRDVLMDVRSS